MLVYVEIDGLQSNNLKIPVKNSTYDQGILYFTSFLYFLRISDDGEALSERCWKTNEDLLSEIFPSIS